MNDLISDSITRIRNALKARKNTVDLLHSKNVVDVLSVLIKEGYIESFIENDIGNNKKTITVSLKYFEGSPVIDEIKRISKCGRRVYASLDDIPVVSSGLGICVMSTSHGVMSDYEARLKKIGGEVICSVL